MHAFVFCRAMICSHANINMEPNSNLSNKARGPSQAPSLARSRFGGQIPLPQILGNCS